MTVKVTERDDSHMSHEGLAAGIRIWDVYQQDLLVGMFHSETDAHNYKAELEHWSSNERYAPPEQ